MIVNPTELEGRVYMYAILSNSIKTSQVLISSVIFASVVLSNNPVLSATKFIPEPLQNKNNTLQNSNSRPAVAIQDIYVAEEGVVLGWFLRTPTSLIAIDASGGLIRIVERVADGSNNNIVEYYPNGFDQGKIKRIGTLNFRYYNGGFEQGKIQSIGTLNFRYYNGGFELRKIQSIGTINFRYYNGGFELGKIQSIGNVNFTYNNDGMMRSMNGTQPGVAVKTTSIAHWRRIMGVETNVPTH